MKQQATLEQQWLGYKEQVISPEACPVQLNETRKAFYAGCLVTMQAVLDASDLPEGQAEECIERLHAELLAYADGVVKSS